MHITDIEVNDGRKSAVSNLGQLPLRGYISLTETIPFILWYLLDTFKIYIDHLIFKYELGPKASCGWGKGRTLIYYKLFNYKCVSFWLIRMAYSLIKACPYMRIKSVILIQWCFTVDRNTCHATTTTVTERGMSCAYFIYIDTNING